MGKHPLEDFFTPEKLLLKISEYRSLDLQNTKLEDIESFFVEIYNMLPLRTINLGNTGIDRVRKIEEGELHLYKKDLWCPPQEKVTKIGRLNNIGESIFYAALDPITAIKEARLNKDDYFSLACYYLNPDVNDYLSTVIVNPKFSDYNLTGSLKIYAMILNDFIFNEFTRHVGVGTEYQYKTSYAISKRLFDLPHKDSIIYPSMVDYSKFNIAIKPDSALNRLRLVQVTKNQFHGYSENGNPIISTYEEAFADEKNEELVYKPFHPDARNMELIPDKNIIGESPNILLKRILKN